MAAWRHKALSLTLTLSRWERELPLDVFLQFASRGAAVSRGFAKALGAFLPLPAGESRGEGEPFKQKNGYSFIETALTGTNAETQRAQRFAKILKMLLGASLRWSGEFSNSFLQAV